MKTIFHISMFIFMFILTGCSGGGVNNSSDNPGPIETSDFLIVGQNGLINNLTNDGSYTNVSLPSTVILGTAQSSSGKIVAVGRAGIIMTSMDGVSWNLENSGVNNSLNHVAVNSHGKFVAVGNGGTILSSLDGINWKAESSATVKNLRSVIVNSSGKFIVVGDSGTILSSLDGSRWIIESYSVPFIILIV